MCRDPTLGTRRRVENTMNRFILCLILLAGPLHVPLSGSLAAQEARVPQSRAEISLSFAPLVRDAAPAVVNIYARRVVQTRSPFADDPLFNNFFDAFPSRPRVQNSLGSGVILSPDGIVVSNYHVVGQATDIRVVLNDRREFCWPMKRRIWPFCNWKAHRICRICPCETAIPSKWGSLFWPSAIRSVSGRPSHRGSYPGWHVPARQRAMRVAILSRRTPRSIRAIRGAP